MAGKPAFLFLPILWLLVSTASFAQQVTEAVGSIPDGGAQTAPAAAGTPDGGMPDAGPAAGQAAAEIAAGPGPLPEDQVKALFAIEADPEPPQLAAGVHFPTSNEVRCYLWREQIKDLGGIFVGVGTDQNYLMAGWSKPDVLILMDFDQLVVDLHLIYRAVFIAANDPQEFIKMWAAKNAKTVIGLLEQSITDPKMQKRIVAAFKEWRRPIEIRMDNLKKWHKDQKIKTFLDDPEQYAFIAGLFRNNRVLAIRGDLTAKKTMRGIGEVAKLMNLPVRVLYLSNAERYFAYTDDYKKNILALPFDQRSLVLRTTGLGSWKNGDPFFYVYQNALNFVEWIKDPAITRVKTIITYRTPQKVKFLYSIEKDPPPPLEKKPPSKAAPTKKAGDQGKVEKKDKGKALPAAPAPKDQPDKAQSPDGGGQQTRAPEFGNARSS